MDKDNYKELKDRIISGENADPDELMESLFEDLQKEIESACAGSVGRDLRSEVIYHQSTRGKRAVDVLKAIG